MEAETWNQKLRRLVAENYTSHRQFAREPGVSEATVRFWFRGNNIPRGAVREKIAELIGPIEFPFSLASVGNVDARIGMLRAEQDATRNSDGGMRTYSQREIASRCKISSQLVNKYEALALAKIARALAISSPDAAMDHGASPQQLKYIREQTLTYDNGSRKLHFMQDMEEAERGAA